MSKLPKTVRTMPAIARLIRAHFKRGCDRQTINGWQTRHHPPFPQADDNNAFNVTECFAWVEALEKRKGKLPAGESTKLEKLERESAESRARKHIIEEERQRFELDKEMGLLIDRQAAQQTYQHALDDYHESVKSEVEKNSPALRKEKLIELGASPEFIAKFHEFDLLNSRAVTDRLEKKYEGGFE